MKHLLTPLVFHVAKIEEEIKIAIEIQSIYCIHTHSLICVIFSIMVIFTQAKSMLLSTLPPHELPINGTITCHFLMSRKCVCVCLCALKMGGKENLL